MSAFTDDCENVVSKAMLLLNSNAEWEARYEKYADTILANIDLIKTKKKLFNEWAPLYIYMNITEAKGRMTFSLRYLGQDVGKLKVGIDKITISTNGYDLKNERDFGCAIKLNNHEWRSRSAAEFRRHFSTLPQRSSKSGKGNEEHRIESALLTEFSKKGRDEKILCDIQPVKIAGIARFQMPTPMLASNMKKLNYSASNGGGVDILARVGTGRATALCIMEIKDENRREEPATKVIQQGLVYATFIRALLMSRSGEKWWKIFGFKGKPREQTPVACVMPSIADNDRSFRGETINKSFPLHYIYFKETNHKLEIIETSLGKNSCITIGNAGCVGV